jgi:hypothetical protein
LIQFSPVGELRVICLASPPQQILGKDSFVGWGEAGTPTESAVAPGYLLGFVPQPNLQTCSLRSRPQTLSFADFSLGTQRKISRYRRNPAKNPAIKLTTNAQ